MGAELDDDGYSARRRRRSSAVRVLRNSAFLADVPTRQLKTLARYAQLVHVPAGTVVIDEGECGSHVCVVLQGDCEVRRGDETLGKIGPGDSFGELAVIDNEPRTASVVATTPSELLALGRSDFAHMLKVAPRLGSALARRADERRAEGLDAG